MDFGGTLGDIVSAPAAITKGAMNVGGDLLKGIGPQNINFPGLSPQGVAAENQLSTDAGTFRTRSESLQGVAAPLMEAFKTGTLTPGEQAELDLAHGAGSAAIEQQAASAGISTSSFAASQRAQLELQTAALKDSFLKGDFSMALQAMGLSDQELGMSGADLGKILGVATTEQGMQLQTSEFNAQQYNQFITEIMGLGMAGGKMAASSGGGGGGSIPGGVGSSTSPY